MVSRSQYAALRRLAVSDIPVKGMDKRTVRTLVQNDLAERRETRDGDYLHVTENGVEAFMKAMLKQEFGLAIAAFRHGLRETLL